MPYVRALPVMTRTQWIRRTSQQPDLLKNLKRIFDSFLTTGRKYHLSDTSASAFIAPAESIQFEL